MDVMIMVWSMTGYGMHTLQVEDTVMTVEIRSVNHRFLDVAIKLPRNFLFMEAPIKKIIQSNFNRGKIEIYIAIEGDGLVRKRLNTDWEMMDKYMEQINLAIDRYSLKREIPTTIMASIPEIIAVQEITHQPDGLKDGLIESTATACEQVKIMRKEEGSFLKEDLLKRITLIYDIVGVLQKSRLLVQAAYRERMEARVHDLITDQETFEPERLHQEIVLLAEKGDITEEITRLYSHIEQMKALINQPGVMGRKLDFITQEMHREANTIGSKSTDAKISEQMVVLKSEIEKIKEQVQNIE